MRLYLFLAGLLLATALSLTGAAPLGAVAARGPVTLNGVELPTAGIPSWPIASGDVLATGTAPAWILLSDRSRIAVAGNSRIHFEDTGEAIRVTLLEGFIDADLRPGSTVTIAPSGTAANEQARGRRGEARPPRARGRLHPPGPPPGVPPRSPNSPCAADPTGPPPSPSPCAPGQGGTPRGQGGP